MAVPIAATRCKFIRTAFPGRWSILACGRVLCYRMFHPVRKRFDGRRGVKPVIGFHNSAFARRPGPQARLGLLAPLASLEATRSTRLNRTALRTLGDF